MPFLLPFPHLRLANRVEKKKLQIHKAEIAAKVTRELPPGWLRPDLLTPCIGQPPGALAPAYVACWLPRCCAAPARTLRAPCALSHPPPSWHCPPACLQVKEDLKTVALGTSKINYLDPRITVAW